MHGVPAESTGIWYPCDALHRDRTFASVIALLLSTKCSISAVTPQSGWMERTLPLQLPLRMRSTPLLVTTRQRVPVSCRVGSRVHHSTTPLLPRMTSSSSGIRPSGCQERCPDAVSPCVAQVATQYHACHRGISPSSLAATLSTSRGPCNLLHSSTAYSTSGRALRIHCAFSHNGAEHSLSCLVHWFLFCLRRLPWSDSWCRGRVGVRHAHHQGHPSMYPEGVVSRYPPGMVQYTIPRYLSPRTESKVSEPLTAARNAKQKGSSHPGGDDPMDIGAFGVLSWCR